MTTLQHIAKKLTLAAMYAEDGAVVTALQRTQAALKLLEKEKARRVRIGLIQPDSEVKHSEHFIAGTVHEGCGHKHISARAAERCVKNLGRRSFRVYHIWYEGNRRYWEAV